MDNKKFKELLKVLIIASKNEVLLGEFLKDILTPKELEEVSNRWEIVRRLHNKESQQAIAKDLRVGIGTVTRGSIEFKDKNGGFAKIFKRI